MAGKLGKIKAIIAATAAVASVGSTAVLSATRRKQQKARKAGKHVPAGPYEAMIKRPLDAAIAAGSLVVLSPVLAVTAYLVRTKLGSPVIFTQERPGLDGKVFKIYKFRTMTDERDSATGELLPDEVRLTNFGKKLRALSLDELPELFNILKGDMALIGPRPLLKQYLPLYNEEQRHRHDVRPGLTGFAQVNGRNAITWEDKFKLDIDYVNNLTMATDAKIFADTFRVILQREGISSETSATMETFEGTPDSAESSGVNNISTEEPGQHLSINDIQPEKGALNVLFLSMAGIGNLESQSIYGDLLKAFAAHGHNVFAVSPRERRTGLPTEVGERYGIKTLDVQTGNLTKCSLVEKGLSQLALESQFEKAIEKYWPDVRFDLILFATPPTTLHGLVKKLKRAHNARTYLLLKDIFPQNSVDLGMLDTIGPKAAIYRFFKESERKTYDVSDTIGCMSEANRRYLLEHEPYLYANKVEVNPNSVAPYEKPDVNKNDLREKLGLPTNEKIMVYGGNLGKPQAIDFFVRALNRNESAPVAFFAIAGSGTERHVLEEFFVSKQPKHAKLFPALSREDFDELLWASDAGIVLLDSRFTIPNFPSRILSYMQASIPYIAATDDASDVGDLAESEGFGIKVSSNDEEAFLSACCELLESDVEVMGTKARDYLEHYFTVERSYEMIMERMNE